MFGILIELIKLPFTIFKLFFELIELVAHVFGGHGHKRHRHKGSRHQTKRILRTKTITVKRSNHEMFQEHMKLLDDVLKISRQEHLARDTRLKGYRTAVEICERAEPYAPRAKEAKASWKKLKDTVVSEQMKVMSISATETTE